MKKITVAVDSFKGSLSSREVAEAFEAGFKSQFPDCEVVKISIADGGEGTVDALVETLDGQFIEAQVADPLGRKISARYGVIDGGHTAVMEMSAASGLPLIAPTETQSAAYLNLRHGRDDCRCDQARMSQIFGRYWWQRDKRRRNGNVTRAGISFLRCRGK